MTNNELADRLEQRGVINLHCESDAEAFNAILAALRAQRPEELAPGMLDDAKLGQECEMLIALKTHFTGEPPYVGNDGVLLALRESLDELKRLKSAQPSPQAAPQRYREVSSSFGGGRMVEKENGEWVKWGDVASLYGPHDE